MRRMWAHAGCMIDTQVSKLLIRIFTFITMVYVKCTHALVPGIGLTRQFRGKNMTSAKYQDI
jgi:hypothetical protein